tara:strand:- start:792 stop:1715 length:924 start_codon:yes stop_codon:yes gene_type:complete
MLKQKKIVFIIFLITISFILLKILDFTLYNKYGLGKPILYSSSKQYGYFIKPNQKVSRKGKNISINNLGMRSQNLSIDKLNKFRILFFGDSVTYGGSLVNNEDLFSEKICEKLNEKSNKFECGNYGTNGYSLFSIIRRIKYTNLDNADLIVLTIIGNNFPRTFHNVLSQPFWSKKIDNFFPALTEVLFIYIDKYRNKFKYNLGVEDINSAIDLNYYKDLIKNLDQTLKEKDIKFIIFYSPSVDEIINKKNNYYFKDYLNIFENFHDISDLKEENKESFYFDNIHLNKYGHMIYSKFMTEKILLLLKD